MLITEALFDSCCRIGKVFPNFTMEVVIVQEVITTLSLNYLGSNYVP
jgi:hypothetical protein